MDFCVSPRNLIYVCIISFALFKDTDQNSREKRQASSQQPSIITQDGHLIFQTAANHNITFKSTQGGFVNVDGENLLSVVRQVKDNKDRLEQIQGSSSSSDSSLSSRMTEVERRLDDLTPTGQVQNDLDQLTSRLNDLVNRVTSLEGSGGSASSSSLRDLTDRVERLENQLQRVKRNLRSDDCSSSPCYNGGTCVDLYNDFFCRCPHTYQGRRCEQDVNECSTLAGTDLGCQNGATCVNTQGGFRCLCTANWYGVRCTQSHDDCSGASNQDLCGHGTCVNQPRSGANQPNYICLCDDGWTTDGSRPECIVDVDECSALSPPCSVAPPVNCVNLPGSFFCDGCPQGYSGNGHVCTDINECQANNGGCSLAPRVDCINTIGSRECGACPQGYHGDGVTCIYVGICNVNNGGCHSLAICRETSNFLGRTCTCPMGYQGSGEGPSGCVAVGSTGTTGACASNPCQHGSCQPTSTVIGYMCTCDSGWSGTNCNQEVNPCQSNPCQNGGTCTNSGNSGYSCQCTDSYTGFNCENRDRRCTGVTQLSGTSGHLTFPQSSSETYAHDSNCAWIITTIPNKILSVTFTAFKLEFHRQCSFDFLQVHDGPGPSDQMIGRYCGTSLPNGGHINSTHNSMYLWFHSDSSTSADGFSLTWLSAEPTCGGTLQNQNHGVIQSPGFPGNYPHNRDCRWEIRVAPGNKILITLGHLALEHHSNCSYDYLNIRDGLQQSDPVSTYCSTGDPAPYHSTGPYVEVVLHTDDSRNDRGFQLSYTAIPLGPACGGELTSASGTLISPNYPNPYTHNAQCVWTISLPGDDIITLEFTALDLEQHRNCRYDYVEVRDGNDELSPFVGRYCGTTVPPIITSSGASLWVKFKADSSNSGEGFRATWNVVCGGELTSPSGELSSPYFPAPYPHERDCVYLIRQPEGSTIVLTFVTFDVEASSNNDCRYDYLEVRSGSSPDSPLVSRLCGSSLPGVITSPGNVLRLLFHTDGSISNHGFRATYTTENTGGTEPDGTGCGGSFSELSGSFHSPSHPNVYPHGANCSWFITAPAGFIVRLTFETFNIENHVNCQYDSVRVYDNLNRTQRLANLCGVNNPGAVMSADNTMLVVFSSDASVAREGFSASYEAINASTVCGGVFRAEAGLLTSPGYPAPYIGGRECTYEIVVSPRQQILLNVTDFSLELSDGCGHDYLQINNGGFATSPLLGRYCGTTIDPILRSHGNRLFLKLVTDVSQSSRGFSIYYDGTQSGCGGEMTALSGSFISPNYPEMYHVAASCYWMITAAHGSFVRLYFQDMDIESASNGQDCRFDYVEVRNDGSSGTSLGRFCGTSAFQHVDTTSNVAWVKFRSDHSGSGRGFQAHYVSKCNNRVTRHYGVIESPGFPNPNPTNQNCSWVIEARLGNTINASFSHFGVEGATNCANNYLQLHDGEDASSPLIGRYCGTNMLPPRVATTGRYLYISYMSQALMAENRFRLEYMSVGCGGSLSGPSGSVRSHGYPEPYPHQRECAWTIQTLPGSRIELTLHDVDIETHPDCQFDYLQALGGLDDTSFQLFKICSSNTSDQRFTSSGNHMMIKFMTDASTNGRGFYATYREIAGGCGGNFTIPSGVITTQNYPSSYAHNSDCTWSITVATGRTVTLTFNDFSVESHEQCAYDYVSVYDGPSSTSDLLLRTCGMVLPNPATLTSSSNQMFIRMRSDGSVSSHGFNASYVTGCGGNINADTDGEIVSPGWPGSYHPNTNCSWILAAQHPDDRLTLTLTHLDISGSPGNCSSDYLQILSGREADSPEVVRICGSHVLPPVVMPSGVAYVRFVSDGAVQASGFRLVYTKSLTACGGELTSDRGSFASPRFPAGYDNDLECIWTLRTSPGNQLMLNFRSFDLEQSPHCNHDYLEVRDDGPAGSVRGRYCGNTLPTNLTVGNNLWVKFRSDGNRTGEGFLAMFNSLYGGEITGTSGQISSPQYPSSYPHNSHYTWHVTTSVGMAIRVRFVTMEIEANNRGQSCSYDYVRIRDGRSSDSAVIGQFCGTDVPAPFMTSTNLMRVEFLSDTSVSYRGFLLEWQAVPASAITPTGIPGVTTGPSSSCGGELVSTDDLQNVTSPGYPGNYPSNANCRWVIRSPEGSRIQLTFVSIDTEQHRYCAFDYIKLHGSAFPSYQSLIGRYCGRRTNVGPIFSPSNVLAVVFRSDTGVERTGFLAQYQTVCGGIMRSPVGIIQSPNYPGNYGNNENCTWTVALPAERQIQVVFTGISIPSPSGGACGGDFVQLYNGQGTDAPPLGNGYYCGSTIATVPLTTSNHLTVRFISDSSGIGAGFSLTYRQYIQGCGGSLTLTDTVTRGNLTSPNYPGGYPSNVDCMWTITVPANERVQIDFKDDFEIEKHISCNFDFIEFRDGGTENAPSMGRFCGTEMPPTLKSSSNVMYVRFRTDGSQAKKGFSLDYSIARCGGSTYNDQSGLIDSPNYPNNYDNNLDCEWRIGGPVGHYLTFTFETFSLSGTENCTGDYLEIRDLNSTGTQLFLGCGYRPSTYTVQTSDNTAYIKLHTDSQGSRRGFRIRFNASVEECGGDMTTPTGVLSSPNYPGSYAHRRHCVWRIRVAEGRRVTLTFNDFNLEQHTHCQYDVVVVQNGAQEHTYMNPAIGAFCGTTNPGTIESSGNEMTVVFWTDGSVSSGGFQATYTSDNPQICGGLLTTADGSGTIQSPGFEQRSYDNGTQCIWQLTNHNAGNGSIAVDFTFMNLETHGECMWDYVEIREGPDENGHYVGRYCGNQTSSLPSVTSPAASLWVLFVADYLVSWQGFQLQYRFTECGGTFSDPSGVITSPNWPAPYSNNNDCAWKIMAPEGSQIQWTLTSLSLPTSASCSGDYVEIYNGGLASSPSVGRHCGTEAPPSALSMSHEIRVEFHSDGVGTDGGFRLEWAFVADACGGQIHAQSGAISSPNWPDGNYPSNAECVWDLNVHNGYHILMDFTPPFDMEIQQPCGDEYVQITEQHPAGAVTQLGKFCGNTFPGGVQTTFNSAKVKLRTNAAVSGHGFSINYTASCGATYTDPTGTIMSPGYPGNYANNMICNYTIVHDDQTFIEMTFDPTHFHIEGDRRTKQNIFESLVANNNDTADSNVTMRPNPFFNSSSLSSRDEVNFRCRYDWISVYEGNSTRGRYLGRFCGHDNEAPQKFRVRGSLFLQFRTDDATTDKGWIANYNTSECGGVFEAEAGSFQTPTYPNSYHHHANCTWAITVPEDRVVRLKFSSFSLEPSDDCNYDAVTVYDGLTQTSQALGTFCGGQPPPVIVSTGRSLLVSFISDGSVAAGGFVAGWTSTFGPSQGCGGILNTTSGHMGSVDIDNDGVYENGLSCTWNINVPDDQTIMFRFTRFLLEGAGPQGDCADRDFVEVRDGMFASSPLIGRYCGTTFPESYTSSGNFLYVKFVTDAANGTSGFRANYRTQPRQCGGAQVATTTIQELMSPGYPISYDANLRCLWSLDAPEGDKVEVKVTNINIQGQGHCQGDSLEFRNIRTSSSDTQPHVYCGNNTPATYISVGRTLEVVFSTDGFGSGRGFRLEYKIASCNTTYYGGSGRITSPGWPGLYPRSSLCEFAIDARMPAPNPSLAIFFNMFNTEPHATCRYDYLEVYAGSNSSSPLISRLCGIRLPDPIFINGTSAWFRFVNDESLHRPGFDITYIASAGECGGNLTIPAGTFTTPNYPGPYTNQTSCRWLITVPARRSVVITFPYFDVPFSEGCVDDSVSVYDGMSDGAARIGQFCGQSMSPVGRNITTTTNRAFVVFSAQGPNPGTGFRLKYWSDY